MKNHRRDDARCDSCSGWLAIKKMAAVVADTLPKGELRVLEGADMVPNAGDIDSLVAEITEFVTGERRSPTSDRPLKALLFTDLVDSTRQATDAGDAVVVAGQLVDGGADLPAGAAPGGPEVHQHGLGRLQDVGLEVLGGQGQGFLVGVVVHFSSPSTVISAGYDVQMHDWRRGLH